MSELASNPASKQGDDEEAEVDSQVADSWADAGREDDSWEADCQVDVGQDGDRRGVDELPGESLGAHCLVGFRRHCLVELPGLSKGDCSVRGDCFVRSQPQNHRRWAECSVSTKDDSDQGNHSAVRVSGDQLKVGFLKDDLSSVSQSTAFQWRDALSKVDLYWAELLEFPWRACLCWEELMAFRLLVALLLGVLSTGDSHLGGLRRATWKVESMAASRDGSSVGS